DEFISRVSHDLRTPLAAIKAAIGVVLANEPPNTAESLRRMFRNIDRATDQMNSMIANLAESVRLKNGPEALHCDVIDLAEIAGPGSPGAPPSGSCAASRPWRAAPVRLGSAYPSPGRSPSCTADGCGSTQRTAGHRCFASRFPCSMQLHRGRGLSPGTRTETD